MLFQVLAVLVLMWHSNINWIKLTHIASFPPVAWKEKKKGHCMERKNKCPFSGCISQHEALPRANMQAAPWALQGLVPGHRWGCLSSILPRFLLSSAAISCPPCLPSWCSPQVAHCIRPWGITCTAWDTWDLSDVVAQSPQPAWGIPCSNIFLELSHVYRLIRNTRIPGTFKTEGCGDSWVCFTFYIRSRCYFLCRLFF